MVAAALLALLVSPAAVHGQCLRVMSNDELSQTAVIIARIRVSKVEKARFRGLYNQLATSQVVEVISGDTNTKEIYIWSLSQTFCASDSYAVGQEMLVFLVREVTFYKTLNYQYGQFLITSDMVQGWRDKDKNAKPKPYGEVVAEIRTALSQRTFSEFNLVSNTNTVVKIPE